MLATIGLGLLGTLMLFADTPPQLSGNWSGDGWGNVTLKETAPGEYAGTSTALLGKKRGEIQLTWSAEEECFNGTWHDAADRSGELSLRPVGNQLRGGYATSANVKVHPGNLAARLGGVTWVRGVAPPAEGARPLDLTPWYSMPASNFDVYSRYPWKAVPRGSHTFANVPLQIGGRITLWGATNNANGQVFQDFANQIAVDRTFDALYVYHATFHVSDEDAAVYALQMKYADDTETTTTIRYGVHVRDWYLREGYPLELTDPRSKVVWEGDPSRGIVNPPLKLRFYITELPNTKREVEVKSISLISAKGNSAACILAITTGPADLLRVDEPSDK